MNLTCCERIQRLLYGKEKTSWELQNEYKMLTGKLLSESNITARCRELRKLGWNVVCKVIACDDRKIYVYGIPKEQA